jgi:putative membrane protein
MATDHTTTNKMEDTTATKAGTNNEFVTKAAGGGMMEVAMGKLAQTNGGSQDIKDFGKMLETDHSNANDKLKSVAASENISIPTNMPDEHMKHVDELSGKKGADFDKAFINMMIEDHEKDIAEFKKAAGGNENAKVKEFASATLPVIEGHLSKAKTIKSKMKM